MLFVLNIAALPYLPNVLGVTNLTIWDRRWGLIPWHIVLAPFFTLFGILMVVFFIAGIVDTREQCRQEGYRNIPKILLFYLGGIVSIS